MTISSTVRKNGPYIGDGSTIGFPFTFKVFAAAELYLVRASAVGDEYVLTLTTDYTVSLNSDQDANPGGTITLLSPLAIGFTLTITSSLPYLQPTDLTNQGGFYPRVISNALDRLTIFCQQISEAVSRSLKTAISTPAGVSSQLPAPVPYSLIGWNSTGTGFANADPTYSTALATDLASSATGKGTALVGIDGSTLANFLKAKSAKLVDSIVALKAIDKTKFTRVFVSGYYAAGDGGGGLYWYDSADTTTADNSGTIIVASDGGRWKMVIGSHLTPENFGAKGDGATDDTAACQALAAALCVLGGGRVVLTRRYKVWTSAPGADSKLFNLFGCRTAQFVFCGGQIVADHPTAGDLQSSFIFAADGMEGLDVINPHVEAPVTVGTQSGVVLCGIGSGLNSATQSKNIRIRNVHQTGGLGGMICYPSGLPDTRSYGLTITGYFSQVYYPANFQGNGDNAEINIITRGCGRSYFPYNVSEHDAVIDSNNAYAIDDVNIAAYTNPNFRNETCGIRLKYRNYGSASLGNAIHFGFLQSDATSRSAIIHDVTVDLDINAGTYPGVYVTAHKYNSSGAADNTARGHNFFNITIKGSARSSTTANAVQLFNAENWTGDFIYNLKLSGYLGAAGAGQNIVIDGRGIAPGVGGIVFEDFATNMTRSLSNIPQNAISYRNVADSGGRVDGDVSGNWAISYLSPGIALVVYKGSLSIANGGGTTVTLPFADKRGTNPQVTAVPKGTQVTFSVNPLTSQTFTITHNGGSPVNFDIFALVYA